MTQADAVVAAADGPFHLHNLRAMQVSSSSSTAAAEPPSLVPLSSNRAADATGRSSGDATSPGLTRTDINFPQFKQLLKTFFCASVDNAAYCELLNHTFKFS